MSFQVSKWEGGQHVTATEGVGVTVEFGSSYIGDGDSSYWAVIAVPGGEETDGEGWTWEKRYSGYTPHREGVIDAPEYVMEAYREHQAAEAAKRREAAEKARAEREAMEAEWEAATPRKGKTVKVVRGRKIPVGTVGTCIWYGEGQWGYRVGIKVEGSEEPLWTAASNVEVVQEEVAAA